MKRESRLGRAALEERVNAILGRRHVPAVPKSRNLAGADSPKVCHETHASGRKRRTQALCAHHSVAITKGRAARTKSSSLARCSTKAMISSAQGRESSIARWYPLTFRNCTIAIKQVRLFPCVKACARAIPAISDTAWITMSCAPKPRKLRGRASAPSSNPRSRTKWGSPFQPTRVGCVR